MRISRRIIRRFVRLWNNMHATVTTLYFSILGGKGGYIISCIGVINKSFWGGADAVVHRSYHWHREGVATPLGFNPIGCRWFGFLRGTTHLTIGWQLDFYSRPNCIAQGRTHCCCCRIPYKTILAHTNTKKIKGISVYDDLLIGPGGERSSSPARPFG